MMKDLKLTILLLLSFLALTGCMNEKVTVAAFNLSFDRATFEQLQDEMATSQEEKDVLVVAYD